MTDRLVDRFVGTVVDLAGGFYPGEHLPFLRPDQPFTTRTEGGRLVVAPESHRRYDLLTAVIVSVDVEGSVRLYRQLRPLVEEAWANRGLPGDPDEALALSGALDASPAVSPLARRAALARLVAAFEPELPLDRAWRLAEELGALFDEMATEDVDPAKLRTLVPERFAEHWQRTLKFLDIVTGAWPDELRDRGESDPAERRVQLLRAQAEAWRAHPPDTPVIAAGSTGSIPAVAELLGVTTQDIIDMAATAEPGAGGLTCLPYFMGQGTPVDDARVSASLHGLTLNTDRANLCRAVIEGLVFALDDVLQSLPAPTADHIHYRVTGGGARSQLWVQILADILEKPIYTFSSQSALGAALIASVGVDLYSSVGVAVQAMVRPDQILHPNPILRDSYRASKARYRNLRDTLHQSSS